MIVVSRVQYARVWLVTGGHISASFALGEGEKRAVWNSSSRPSSSPLVVLRTASTLRCAALRCAALLVNRISRTCISHSSRHRASISRNRNRTQGQRGRQGRQGRPEQGRAGQSRAEQGRAGQSKSMRRISVLAHPSSCVLHRGSCLLSRVQDDAYHASFWCKTSSPKWIVVDSRSQPKPAVNSCIPRNQG
jgi:hypothetical protein